VKPALRVAALTAVGVLLLCVSYFSTSYDRAYMAQVEFLLGVLLLAIALVTSLIGIDKPAEKKPAKATPPAD